MGLVSDLGFEVGTANMAQRGVQRLGALKPFSWLFQKMLYRFDRPLYRRTGGKVSMSGLLAGVPVILLTTTGARTGEERTMPLLGIPMGESVAVIGSNYGQKTTPGWVYNLQKTPEATVTFAGRTVPVVARHATEDETREAFRLGSAIYGGYDTYQSRVAGTRTIHVFILDTATS